MVFLSRINSIEKDITFMVFDLFTETAFETGQRGDQSRVDRKL